MANMTDKQYVEHGGTSCPACGTENSARLNGNIECDGKQAWGNCSCDHCGAIWVDVYNLVGYDNLQKEE